MNTPDIITWLREQAIRMPEEVHKRGMIRAASMLERLENNLSTAVAHRNEYQKKYLDERERNAALESELKDEMHRYDRLQDFEVAEAEELRKLKEQSRWIPVTERLPEEEGKYLCNVKSFAFRGSFYQAILRYDKYGFAEGHIYTDDVTHWRPLPEEPKEEA